MDRRSKTRYWKQIRNAGNGVQKITICQIQVSNFSLMFDDFSELDGTNQAQSFHQSLLKNTFALRQGTL